MSHRANQHDNFPAAWKNILTFAGPVRELNVQGHSPCWTPGKGGDRNDDSTTTTYLDVTLRPTEAVRAERIGVRLARQADPPHRQAEHSFATGLEVCRACLAPPSARIGQSDHPHSTRPANLRAAATRVHQMTQRELLWPRG